MERVRFGRRVAAFLIDYVLVYVLANVLFFVYVLLNPEHFQTESAINSAALMFGYFWWTLGWPYFAIMEGLPWASTPGKFALGAKIMSSAGNGFNFVRSIQRSFVKIFVSQLFLGFGYLMAAVRKDKLAMHDIFAKTVVVRRKSRPANVEVKGDESTT